MHPDIIQGFVLMAVGMSSVFILLTVLVALLNLSARFFESWPLDEIKEPNKSPSVVDNELEMIAIAIAAAARSSE